MRVLASFGRGRSMRYRATGRTTRATGPLARASRSTCTTTSSGSAPPRTLPGRILLADDGEHRGDGRAGRGARRRGPRVPPCTPRGPAWGGGRATIRDLDRASRSCRPALWSDAAALAERLDAVAGFSVGLRLTAGGRLLAERLALPDDAPLDVALWASSPPPMTAGSSGCRPSTTRLERRSSWLARSFRRLSGCVPGSPLRAEGGSAWQPPISGGPCGSRPMLLGLPRVAAVATGTAALESASSTIP